MRQTARFAPVAGLLLCTLCGAQTYTITTVAGTGTSIPLNFPGGVLVEGAGNLYIADTRNNAVRMLTPGGRVVTVAGGNGWGFSGDGGPATAAKLGGPKGLALDMAGNLYIGETSMGQRVRRVSPDGTITSVAGGGSCSGSGYFDGKPASRAALEPHGLALDREGNLFIATFNHVRKLGPDGAISTVAGTPGCTPAQTEGFAGDGGPAIGARMRGALSVAVDRAGNLYIADFYSSRVRKVDTSGTITTIAGNGVAGSGGFQRSLQAMNGRQALEIGIRPDSLAVDNSGNLFIADEANSCVWRMTRDGRMQIIAGGAFDPPKEGALATSGVLRPTAITLGKRGTIYVAEEDYSRVRLLTPTKPPVEVPDEVSGGPASGANEPFTISNFSPGEITPKDLANRVSGAISANDGQYKNLLYKWELLAEFSGTKRNSPFPVFGPPSGETVHSQMPLFRGHFQLADGEPYSVMDGWEDQPPLTARSLRERRKPSQPGEPATLDLIQHLLRQQVRIAGVATERGSRAYVIESLPRAEVAPAQLTGTARCAAAIRATIFVDAKTFFPVRLDAEVVTPGMCSPARNLPLDSAGTKEQAHYARVSRQDPCGGMKEVWVLDQATQRMRINAPGYVAFPGAIAQRMWPLNQDYVGGEFKGTTTRKDFQLFVTGACLQFGDVVESRPVESVRSEIHFALDDEAIPFQGIGRR